MTLAADPDDAFRAATSDGVDVIVIASDDPAIRGERLALCTRLAAEPRTKNIPILLTSAAFDQQELQVATDTGVLALVVESVDSAKLVSAVQGVIAARRKPSPVRASLGSKDESVRSR